MAAGKAIAGKTRQARETQKTALAEVNVIIANHKAKKAAERQPVEEPNPVSNPGFNLSTTQWLALGLFVCENYLAQTVHVEDLNKIQVKMIST